MAKNRFKVFKKLDENKDSYKPIKMDSAIVEMAYIPPEAFKQIYNHKNHEHLQGGLNISRHPLRLDDFVREAAKDINLYIHKDVPDYEEFRWMSWMQAKKLAVKMGGRIPMPGEMICALDYARDNDGWLWKDLTQNSTEAIDAIFTNMTEIILTPKIDENDKIIGNKKYNRYYSKFKGEEWFNIADMDPETGLPGYLRSGGKYRFRKPYKESNRVVTIMPWDLQMMLDVTQHPGLFNWSSTVYVSDNDEDRMTPSGMSFRLVRDN